MIRAMLNKKFTLFQSLLLLSLTATLAACSGSTSKYEVAGQKNASQTTAPTTSINSQSQQTSAVDAPAQTSKTSSQENQNGSVLENASRAKAAQEDPSYSSMDFSAVGGRQGLQYILYTTQYASLVKIKLKEVNDVKKSEIIALASSDDQALLSDVQLLMSGKITLKDGFYNNDVDTVATHASFIRSANGEEVYVLQPVIVDSKYANLFDRIRAYILSKMKQPEVVAKPERISNRYAPSTETAPATTTSATATANPTPTPAPSASPAKEEVSHPADNSNRAQPRTAESENTNRARARVETPTPALQPACSGLDLNGLWKSTYVAHSTNFEIKLSFAAITAEKNISTFAGIETKTDLDHQDEPVISQNDYTLDALTCILIKSDKDHGQSAFKINDVNVSERESTFSATACKDLSCNEIAETQPATLTYQKNQ